MIVKNQLSWPVCGIELRGDLPLRKTSLSLFLSFSFNVTVLMIVNRASL